MEFNNVGGVGNAITFAYNLHGKGVEECTVPAEIWHKGAKKVIKLLVTEQEIVSIEFDPYLETADIDVSNNR